MTGLIWADYSDGYPGAVSLRAAGFTGAIRYIGEGSSGKRLSASERADFDANGFPYLLVCELDVTDAEGGYARGQQFAVDALADARYKGVPDSIPIACAADEHLALSLIPAAVEFARGFSEVVGPARAGAYGFSEFVAAVHAAGHASWYWQSGNPPDVTGTDGFVNFWQRNGYDRAPTTSNVNGVTCDINDQLLPLTAAGLPAGMEDEDMAVPYLNPSGWLLWVDLGSGRVEDTGRQLSDAATYNGLPIGKVSADREAALRAMDSRWGTVQNVAAVAASVTVDPAVVKAAVTAALQGLSLSVSPADQTAIANAVVTVLGQKLSTKAAG